MRSDGELGESHGATQSSSRPVEGPRSVSRPVVAQVAPARMEYEKEVLRIEDERVRATETQATAILTLVVAIAAFGASALDRSTLLNHRPEIAVVAFALLLSAGFALAARGPRALRARFWRRLLPRYDGLERRLEAGEADLTSDLTGAELDRAIVENWRARRSISQYLAERKALWLTLSLVWLLGAFVATGFAALVMTA